MTPPTHYIPLLAESKLRRDIFRFLEIPRTRDEIKEVINVNSPNMTKLLNALKEANLVTETDRVCKLTEIGKVVLDHFKPFLDTVEAIEANDDFWRDHDISGIPPEFLLRIKELKECKVITEECTPGTHTHFVENVSASNFIYGVTTVFDPKWTPLFLDLARKGVPIRSIVTEKVFNIIKRDHASELEDGLLCPNAQMFVGGSQSLAFVVTNRFLSVSLVSPKGGYDCQSDLVGYDQASIKWGTDLFNYYKENSIEIKGVVAPNEWIKPQGQLVENPGECP